MIYGRADAGFGRSNPIYERSTSSFGWWRGGYGRSEILPIKGKHKPNVLQERRGKQNFKRSIINRDNEYPNYQKKIGHIGGRTC